MATVAGNIDKMKKASGDVADLKMKYSKAVEEINRLITVELAKYWNNERYNELNSNFKNKSYSDLNELGETIQAFSVGLDTAAIELEKISR